MHFKIQYGGQGAQTLSVKGLYRYVTRTNVPFFDH